MQSIGGEGDKDGLVIENGSATARALWVCLVLLLLNVTTLVLL